MECWSFLAAAGELVVRARQAVAWLSASTNHTWTFAEHLKECDVLKLADASKTFLGKKKKKKLWNTPASVTKGERDVEEKRRRKTCGESLQRAPEIFAVPLHLSGSTQD